MNKGLRSHRSRLKVKKMWKERNTLQGLNSRELSDNV